MQQNHPDIVNKDFMELKCIGKNGYESMYLYKIDSAVDDLERRHDIRMHLIKVACCYAIATEYKYINNDTDIFYQINKLLNIFVGSNYTNSDSDSGVDSGSESDNVSIPDSESGNEYDTDSDVSDNDLNECVKFGYYNNTYRNAETHNKKSVFAITKQNEE